MSVSLPATLLTMSRQDQYESLADKQADFSSPLENVILTHRSVVSKVQQSSPYSETRMAHVASKVVATHIIIETQYVHNHFLQCP